MIPKATDIIEASKLFKTIVESGVAGGYYYIYGEFENPVDENTHGLISWYGDKYMSCRFPLGAVASPEDLVARMISRMIEKDQSKADWAWILDNSEQVRETLSRVHTVLSGDIADNELYTKYTYCLKMMNQIRCKLPFPDCHMLSDWEGKSE